MRSCGLHRAVRICESADELSDPHMSGCPVNGLWREEGRGLAIRGKVLTTTMVGGGDIGREANEVKVRAGGRLCVHNEGG